MWVKCLFFKNNYVYVFCKIDINKCFASEGFQIYYTDDNHLTIEGSALLIEYIFSEIQNYLDQ